MSDPQNIRARALIAAAAARRFALENATLPGKRFAAVEAGPAIRPTRTVAIGDPQASLETFFNMLDHQGLLGDDGLLAPDVALLSIGDHFDYPGVDQATTGRDALALLSWLAAHPAGRVRMLLGNHDTARVQELVTLSDERFAQARAAALERRRRLGDFERHSELARTEFHRYLADFPDVPAPGLVARDFDSYSTAQRELMMRLLLGGRFQLAEVGRLPGGLEVLITHAGITHRELELLGIPCERRAPVIAARLNRWLEEAVERVRPAWERGENARLELEPVHVPGGGGHNGGGLLYHRPSNPDRPVEPGQPPVDTRWELDPARPRRFHPLEMPTGLVQACGHCGHRKCLKELGPWATSEAVAMPIGGLRTLRAGLEAIVYEPGVRPGGSSEATLLLIDGELGRLKRVEDYAVLELEGWGER